jgi:hypothetical protein
MGGPLNYTTTISAEKTATECVAILARAGADAVALTYENKQPASIAFRLETPHGSREFTLPVNVGGMHKCLLKAGLSRKFTDVEQARRVAWRVAKNWLEAQVAIIDAQMVTIDEVFLPYLQVGAGHTVYEAYRERELHLSLALQLEAGAS